MEVADYSRFIFAFLFVIVLIWTVAAGAKKFGLDKKMRGIAGAQGRLQVTDTLYLDPRKKILLVRADAREYLLLIAGDSATVIDTLEVRHETVV